jgi:LCP family protein required for cell wall assembly
MTDRPRRRHAALAAFLSFLFPGLGQAYAGEAVLAAVFAAPVILLLIGSGALVMLIGQVRNDLLSATFLAGAAVLNLALMAWRLASIILAGRPRRGSGRRLASVGTLLLLVVATVAMHAWTASAIGQVSSTLDDVFAGGISGPGGGGPLNRPDYRWDGTERITFLLLGIDSAAGRPEALTDTILVVTIDPVARTEVMISIPRDSGYLPLPDSSVYVDGVYPWKINQLTTDADQNPAEWCPDLTADAAAECGLRTLERVVGLYVGIPIQYYATVDLQGFADLIDALGGVTLCLDGKLVDPEYGGPTWHGVGIELAAGCQQYDGPHALAYARVRKGWMELPDGTLDPQDDFKRSDRQQVVLLELRKKLAQADLFFALPSILRPIGRTVHTDFPRALAGDLASLLPLITDPGIQRVVLGYPEFVDPPLDPFTNYLLIPRRDDIRTEMQGLFGPVLDGWYMGSDVIRPPVVAP